MDGFFIMMLDEPVEWNDEVEKEKALDYVFEHQRMTKVNTAILSQFGAARPEDILGKTPADFFAHDIAGARERWRAFFDSGTFHNETDERRLDGTPLRIEGDYTVIHDEKGRIAGHFGIQHDITDRYQVNEEIKASRQQLRALASRLEQAREDERTQIAREIHDELGQALTGLKLDISWMRSRLPKQGALGEQCESIIQRIDKTIESVRRIATDLRPSILDQLGLEAAVEWQSQQFISRTGIVVSVRSSVDKERISDVLASSAFRILQESLTNIARHSQATAVDVSLVQTGSLLLLEIEDNGIGVPPGVLEKTSSLGLIGMRERAIACGGKLTIASGPGTGTIVQLTVPLAQGAFA